MLGSLAGAAVLLAGFIAVELRAKAPILPFSIFRLKSLTGANIVGLLLGAAIFSMFFLLSLYMQQVLGYSALKAGVAYLLVASVIIVAAGASQALVTRIGVRSVLITGMVLLVAGLLWFSQVSVHGSYATDLAPGFILAGIGLGFSFVPVQIASLIGVTPRRGRHRLRPDQHLAAGRRRARRRGAVDDHVHRVRLLSGRPRAQPGVVPQRARGRLPRRLPGRRRAWR